ncbi:MAG: hypothetical protein WDW36_005033 [Sanguina aurantia]
MGKARGRGGGKPRNPRPKRAGDPDSSSEEETSFKPTQRGLGRQGNNVGMLPSSDESEGEEEVQEGAQPGPDGAPAVVAPPVAVVPVAAPAPKPKPPARPVAARKDDSSSEEDETDEDEDSSDEDDAPAAGARPLPSRPAAAAAPQNYLSQPAKPKDVAVIERDPEEIRQEVERLALIRKKRDADKVQRIKMDGWDRYLPVGDGNRPAWALLRNATMSGARWFIDGDSTLSFQM